ncbi:MAG: nuclear transport factor 2 family protein [Nitrospira sp.]|nr:nuclear transport factor 2 family protein [Nitrospira sp.]
MICRRRFVCCVLTFFIGVPIVAIASEPSDPESAIRRMVRANAEKDLPTLSRLMAHDADIISYAVAGRKYIGWTELEKGMREEFINSQKLEIPIHELKVWTKGDMAWYVMELDYIRYVAEESELKRTVLPMRETGVLERRNGSWQLLSWHESFRSSQLGESLTSPSAAVTRSPVKTSPANSIGPTR